MKNTPYMGLQQTPGRIFLADNRAVVENNNHLSFSTLGNQPDTAAFGNLHTFNDETIPAKETLVQQVGVSGFTLIIPITGAVICKYEHEAFTVDAGQVLLLPALVGKELTVTNPFTEDWVNFLHVEVASGETALAQIFDFEGTVNEVIDVISAQNKLPFSLHIGCFGGRQEMLQPLAPGQSLFAFVIAGVFELQNRLLHERDALALWDVNEVDAEALSNDAVLLYMIL